MKNVIFAFVAACLLTGCCTTIKTENNPERDSKIQHLEQRIDRLEKRVDELHPNGYLPLN